MVSVGNDGVFDHLPLASDCGGVVPIEAVPFVAKPQADGHGDPGQMRSVDHPRAVDRLFHILDAPGADHVSTAG